VTQRARPPRPDYGVDGYPYLLGLLAASAALGAGSALAAALGRPTAAALLAAAAVVPAAPAALGLRYVLRGKREHRDRLLDRVAWRGDESVLDVGTGGGLL
jgi:arsenite methyltransferase